MKNYIHRSLFAIGMIASNILRLAFGLLGIVFHFGFSTTDYLLVVFGWYNKIEDKKLGWENFNPVTPITFFNTFYN